MMGFSVFMLAITSTPVMLFTAAVLYGISVGLNSPAITAWTVDLGNPLYKGRALASMYIAMEAGIGLGAYLSVFIYHNNAAHFPLTFYCTSAATLLASVYLMFFYNHRQVAHN